jgi:hypothetical protein
MKTVMQEYWEKYGTVPEPIGIGEEVIATVVAEYLKKGAPVPLDYDWYVDIPDGAPV